MHDAEAVREFGHPRSERRFERFAEATSGGRVAPTQDPRPFVPAGGPLEEPSGEAYAAKPFIGPHATYYDDRWRWMDWRGRKRGWNSAAATTCGVWLGYRKMYRWAVIYLAIFSLLVVLMAGGLPIRFAAIVFLAGNILLGVYANTLYFQHFKTVARAIGNHHADYRTTLAALATAGGVDPAGARLMTASLIGITGLVLGLASLAGSLDLRL